VGESALLPCHRLVREVAWHRPVREERGGGRVPSCPTQHDAQPAPMLHHGWSHECMILSILSVSFGSALRSAIAMEPPQQTRPPFRAPADPIGCVSGGSSRLVAALWTATAGRMALTSRSWKMPHSAAGETVLRVVEIIRSDCAHVFCLCQRCTS